jgi:hypothetical protein
MDSERNTEARELAAKCTFDDIAEALAATGRCYRACQELASYLVHPITTHTP